MISRAQVYDALSSVVDADSNIVVIHSSLPRIGRIESTFKWEILAAIKMLVAQGITVAVPAFTFSSFASKGVFSLENSPSEVGILGDWLRDLSDATRSAHPLYSFVSVGPLSENINNSFGETTVGTGSAFEFFEQQNATIVMLGCDWLFCTQFHRYEELSDVPYRYHKEFKGTVDLGDGLELSAACMFVRELGYDNENNFDAFVTEANKQNVIRRAALGECVIQSIRCSDLKSIAMAQLDQDPFIYVENRNTAEYNHRQLAKAMKEEPLRIAVVGSANLDTLGSTLKDTMAPYFQDREIEVYVAPFGQYRQQSLDPNSELVQFSPRIIVAVERIEDLFGDSQVSSIAVDTSVFDKVSEYLDIVEALAEKTGASCFVASLPRLVDSAIGTAEIYQESAATLIHRLNEQIHQRVREKPFMHLLDLARLVERMGYANAVDHRLWFLGRIPFSEPFNRTIADAVAGGVMAELGKTVRAIALDLDGTLWGGVLGEDDIEGIQLGGDYPGNAFCAFQECLKQLSARGVSLVLLSKNDEDHALRAIKDHPDMVLSLDIFVSHRINWNSKWQNLSQIADEMNLGLESFLFVDDNPIEREQMRQALPGVKVFDLPDDPAQYVTALIKSPYLECLSVTEEDKRRVRSYQSRAQLVSAQNSFSNPEEFYASLDLKVFVQKVASGTMARTLQLINKTNQFNTTTRRYTRPEIERIAASSDSDVFVIGAMDRFNDRENIGVVVINWRASSAPVAEIDALLFSCRALGRGIERSVMGWIASECKEHKIDRLQGRIIPTDRNTLVQPFYKDNGFTVDDDDETMWVLDVSDTAITLPSWVTIDVAA